MHIESYLTFGGNCRDAMQFYRDCLGGVLALQAVGDSPLANGLPKAVRNRILHATLKRDNLVLMGTDMVGDKGLHRGNAVSLCLQCTSEEELWSCYESLSSGGTTTHPPVRTFNGGLFGSLADRYGNHWLLHCSSPPPAPSPPPAHSRGGE